MSLDNSVLRSYLVFWRLPMRLDQFTVKAQEAITSAQTLAEKATTPRSRPSTC